MGGKADVIVTEIFDSELLGEGILPTMRHAKSNLLKACRKGTNTGQGRRPCLTPQTPKHAPVI